MFWSWVAAAVILFALVYACVYVVMLVARVAAEGIRSYRHHHETSRDPAYPPSVTHRESVRR